jgi:hypothetical protein
LFVSNSYTNDPDRAEIGPRSPHLADGQRGTVARGAAGGRGCPTGFTREAPPRRIFLP